MALRNARFEDMDDTAVAVDNSTTAEVVAEVAAKPAANDAKEAVRAALATVTANPVATSALKTSTTLDNLKFVIDPDMLAGMGVGAFPRIVLAPGAFNDKATGKSLGDTLDVEVLSWNTVTLVTTGEKTENKEATKLIRNSYDGVNLVGGEGRVDAYVAKLKAMDYDKAGAKTYVEIYGYVHATGKGPVEDVKLTQISISPTSVGAWNVFLLEQRIRASKGNDVKAMVRITSDSKSANGNTWGLASFRAI